MQVEELLQMLRDAGMDDGAISELLQGAMAQLQGPAEGQQDASAESEADKADRVFGCI